MRDLVVFLFVLQVLIVLPQTELNYPDVRFGPELIKANWVSHPEIHGGEDVAVLFRNVFAVDDPSEEFIINISADNHYFLYVNGQFVTHGPQLGDPKHWKYETLDLKPYLKKGKNTIAVKVMNYGKRRFLGFQSLYTSLMVNGVTANALPLTTKGQGGSWRCTIDRSYRAREVHWRSKGVNRIIGGFYANNPTDAIAMGKAPKNWEQPTFDDSAWSATTFYEGASSMGGAVGYLLEPRNVPLLSWEREDLGPVVRASNFEVGTFPEAGESKIPAHTHARFLIDHKRVTTGFPELVFSGGADAKVSITYAENLFGPNNEKGDRNVYEGKQAIGYGDLLLPDGSRRQRFIPSWMRTFRFIAFDIKTKDQPLVLHSFGNHKSLTTIPSSASFHSDNARYNEIFEICKRTVDLCTQDYFLSDAYYETMQYIGDTKVHAQLWQAFSGNLDHTRNAIRQFHQSRDAEGNLLGAYPLRSTFIFPTYSLIWVTMIADYYRLSGDLEFVKELAPGIVHTLDGFDQHMGPDQLVEKTIYRYFVDWYQGPQSGGGTATKNGGDNSAVVSLFYVLALQEASTIFEALQQPEAAARFGKRADEIKKAVYERCYDTTRQLFAERPDKTIFDQHTNIMAILTDALPAAQQGDLLQRILTEGTLLQASYYFRYYLFEAIKKVGNPELFAMAQQPWQQMVDDHMTTTLERFESPYKPTRSEVHPWSASPALFYLTYLAGIQSMENNYSTVSIAPVFGELNTITGSMPTANGLLHFNLKKTNGSLLAEITMPNSSKGELRWNGKSKLLQPGKNQYRID